MGGVPPTRRVPHRRRAHEKRLESELRRGSCSCIGRKGVWWGGNAFLRSVLERGLTTHGLGRPTHSAPPPTEPKIGQTVRRGRKKTERQVGGGRKNGQARAMNRKGKNGTCKAVLKLRSMTYELPKKGEVGVKGLVEKKRSGRTKTKGLWGCEAN